MSDEIMTKERQKLIDYWENAPPMKFIDLKQSDYRSHPSRPAILRILLEGMAEEDTVHPINSKKRHVLNAAEIQKILLERKDIEISRTNLYFHLNTLDELGLIKTVTTILEGPHKRNKTKYYGRVARSLFIGSQEESHAKYNRMFQDFEKLAKLLDITLPQLYSNLSLKLVERNQQMHQQAANWLINHEKIITKENLDISELFEFMKLIYRLNSQYFEGLSAISEIIHELM